MVYTSNADVLYRRKKNPYQGTSKGTGYGYGSLASTLLKAYVGKGLSKNKKTKMNLKRKQSSLSSTMQRRTKNGIQYQEGSNSLTKCNFGTGKCTVPRSVLLNLAPEIYVANFAENSASTVGLQTYSEIPHFDSGSIAALSGFQIYKELFLESVKAEVNLVNASESSDTVTIYDIISRSDCSVAGKNSSPGAAWSYGIDSEGGSSTDYKIVGSCPTDSVMFNKFYKIVQRTRINMGPGQMHRHEVTFRPNRKVQGFWVDAVPYGLAGLTCWTLIVHHGQPAHDSTTTTNVTIDVSSLDIVRKTCWTYKFLENSTINWQKSNTLATTFAVGEQFVNEAVGQVVDAAGLHPGTLHS